MSRKLLLFGGLSVASIATITPTGIHFQKEAQKRKAEKVQKERDDFINESNDVVKGLNNDSENRNLGITFLKNSEDDDKWKLMWIADIWLYYKEDRKYESVRNPMKYTQEEMNYFEKIYWENQISKQQGKWDKKMTKQWLNYANSKSQYWEKFKEICLILIVNGKIDKDENMSTVANTDKNLCIFSKYTHGEQLNKYKEYKKTPEPRLGIMEHFWKGLENRNQQTIPPK